MLFFQKKIEYLGYIVDKDGLHPQDSKLDANRKIGSPVVKRSIQVFISMFDYYRRFIKNFANIAEPLFYLL